MSNTNMQTSNLWILTEERPKKEVLKLIINKFLEDNKFCGFIDHIKIIPILNNNQFSFTYQVIGVNSTYISNIFIQIVSGSSSFVDYLIYYQNNTPTIQCTPCYAIEETKTTDNESRNTGVFQRATKFVYAKLFFQNTRSIMLYNNPIQSTKKPSQTNIFGNKCFATIGVEFLGKTLNDDPFTDIDDLINFKNNMRPPPKGNVPIQLSKDLENNTIYISGKLVKNGRIGHDPNIGAITLISYTLRILGWQGRIIITHHGLPRTKISISRRNKFIRIAQQLDIYLEDITIQQVNNFIPPYWHFDINGEKNVTIFIHLLVENFTEAISIYENHAGCERGYFKNSQGDNFVIEKYQDKALYKQGDRSQIIHIPDLVLADFNRKEIINIEGKKYQNKLQGIKELNNFDAIEELYIKKYYTDYKIIRTVVLFGSNKTTIEEVEVSFLLNSAGNLILGVLAPDIFKDAIGNLFNYWQQDTSSQ